MKIILNGSVDLYEDDIDFEDLEVEIEDENDCDIEDYMMDCDECGFCDLDDEEEYKEETVKNVALYELLDYMFTLFEDE